MTPAQRRTHLRVWIALAILLPIGVVAAVLARRGPTARPPAGHAAPAAPDGEAPR